VSASNFTLTAGNLAVVDLAVIAITLALLAGKFALIAGNLAMISVNLALNAGSPMRFCQETNTGVWCSPAILPERRATTMTIRPLRSPG
jgi:hypothetical protein